MHSGSRTLKDAVNDALRDWVTNLSTTHYLVGSAIGPHPFPTIVRDFQKVISEEIKLQMNEAAGKLPDVVVACVGGGSNAIGTFFNFIPDKNVRLVGVEAGGEGGPISKLSFLKSIYSNQASTAIDTVQPCTWVSLVSYMVSEPTSCSHPPARS